MFQEATGLRHLKSVKTILAGLKCTVFRAFPPLGAPAAPPAKWGLTWFNTCPGNETRPGGGPSRSSEARQKRRRAAEQKMLQMCLDMMKPRGIEMHDRVGDHGEQAPVHAGRVHHEVPVQIPCEVPEGSREDPC